MEGDKKSAESPTGQANPALGNSPATEPALFCESEDLGVGASQDAIRRAEEARLAAITGMKLRRARRLAGLSESQAGLALAQSGMTMISLYENGHRQPSATNLRMLAQLYGVTTDYLLDMHDDITAVPEDGNQAVLRGVISTSLTGEFARFIDALTRRNGIMIEALSLDRVLLSKVAEVATDLVSALEIFKAHTPHFEDIRGGAKLVRLVGELHGSMSEQIRRREREQALVDYEPFGPAPEQIARQVQQLLF